MLRRMRMRILLGTFALAMTAPAWALLYTYTDAACANYYWTAPNVAAYHAWKQAGLVQSYIIHGEVPPICRQ